MADHDTSPLLQRTRAETWRFITGPDDRVVGRFYFIDLEISGRIVANIAYDIGNRTFSGTAWDSGSRVREMTPSEIEACRKALPPEIVATLIATSINRRSTPVRLGA